MQPCTKKFLLFSGKHTKSQVVFKVGIITFLHLEPKYLAKYLQPWLSPTDYIIWKQVPLAKCMLPTMAATRSLLSSRRAHRPLSGKLQVLCLSPWRFWNVLPLVEYSCRRRKAGRVGWALKDDSSVPHGPIIAGEHIAEWHIHPLEHGRPFAHTYVLY